jgi:two-component system, chemotaxis family, sensor kinase CheA
MRDKFMADDKNDGFDLTQFYQIFFEEAGENLEQMEHMLLNLDLDTADDEELNAIFRCAHSIKGGAATFGFEDVAELTHQMESLLDKLRRHELTLTMPMVDVLLEVLGRPEGAAGPPPGLGGDRPKPPDWCSASACWPSGGAVAAPAPVSAPVQPLRPHLPPPAAPAAGGMPAPSAPGALRQLKASTSVRSTTPNRPKRHQGTVPRHRRPGHHHRRAR